MGFRRLAAPGHLRNHPGVVLRGDRRMAPILCAGPTFGHRRLGLRHLFGRARTVRVAALRALATALGGARPGPDGYGLRDWCGAAHSAASLTPRGVEPGFAQ